MNRPVALDSIAARAYGDRTSRESTPDDSSIAARAHGGSMYPTIEPGSRLLIERGVDAKYRVGDIIALIGPTGGLIAHRLIAISGRRAWTRGDDAPWPDAPSPLEAIVGRIDRGGVRGRSIARLPVLALLFHLANPRNIGQAPELVARYIWRRIRRYRRP